MPSTYVNPNADFFTKAGAISSSTLTPIPSSTFQTPQQTPIYPVAGLNNEVTPPLTPTAPETKANDLSTQLAALNDQLVGQSVERATQEEKQGIPDLTKTQNDLSARLKGLQNEALAIPLQLQQDATGRGMTTGGFQPIQTAALRNNAIQSLSVSSLLEASRGNLTYAQSLVDKAIAQKFDPIKEEIAAKSANLDLILKSPAYSLADKNRAQAQKDIQDANARAVAKQAADAKEIYDAGLTALKYGADTATVQAIQAATTPQEAIQIGAKYLTDPKAKYELESLRLGNQLKTQQIQTEIAQRNKIAAETPTAGAPIPSISDTGAPASGVKESALNSITGLKLNESQSNAVSYAFRMIEANTAINNRIGDGGAQTGTYNPTTLLSAIGRTFHTDNARTQDRDEENFIRAQLRKESGAQISDAELAGGKKLYSPSGIMTNAKDIEQTKQSREQAIQSMIAQAGPAGQALKQYFHYMKTGGLTADEAAILYDPSYSQPSSTQAVISGSKFY